MNRICGVNQMTTMMTQLKTEYNYSKVEHFLSVYYEQKLQEEISKIFAQMRYEIIKNLTEYYSTDAMYSGSVDLILAPIHEAHKKYYETILKFDTREFDKARASGKRIVERFTNFKRKGKIVKGKYSLKSDLEDTVATTINKDKLFGTSEIANENLTTRTYKLSEKTLSRVDEDINDIIVKGYEEGKGINSVSHTITKRFNQLETWESKRIARTEIHNSQTLGVITGYNEMGVEYIQWSSAGDNRVRDIHRELDGEIIRMGDVFSNGLHYPGDMMGSAKEIINCRCQALPFIIPYGYIAPPDMVQFREDDLISVDVPDFDELIKQATEEANLSISNSKGIVEELSRSNEFDIYRLPPSQRDHYLKIKKNHDLLKEAIETKDYSKLNELDSSATVMIESERSVEELGDDFLELAKEELEDYISDINDYERIIKDKNIKVTLEPNGIKWKNKGLHDNTYMNYDPSTDTYSPFNVDEKFVKYHFKKENLTIYESVDMDNSRVLHIYEGYKKLPKRLQNTKEIVLSSQTPYKISLGGLDDAKFGGYVLEGKSNRIIQFKKSLTETIDTLVHETTHNIEKDKLYYISNSKEYVLAFKKDQRRLLAQGKTLKESYVTDYSYGFTEAARELNSPANRIYGHRIYSEDLAESMKVYLRNKKSFTKDFPEKAKVLEKILKGELNPKTTIPYKKWVDVESKRFKLTSKEIKRNHELRWKQTDLAKEGKKLSHKELKELEYYEDKTTFDYLYNKKIKAEILNDAEEKAFKDISKKWKKKLKLNDDVLLELEIKDEKLTNAQIRRKLSKISDSERIEKLREILSDDEYKEYLKLIKKRNSFIKKLKKNPKIKGIQNAKKEADKIIFIYEKRIFRRKKKLPKVDKTKYALDNQEVGGSYSTKNTILEKKQIKKQENISWSNDEKFAINLYGGGNHKLINGFIRQDEYWKRYIKDLSKDELEELINDIETWIKDLDSAIAKTHGLTQDTTLLRADDYFDTTLEVGDYGNFSGFPSTSYQERGADQFMNDERYKVTILAPKGTKGIAMNGKHGWNAVGKEHEYLLPQNQKYLVLEVNHNPKIRTATVLLL